MGLILSRRPTQKIIIEHAGERCEVTVLDIKGNRVRLDLIASDNWRIDREEIDLRRTERNHGDDR